MTQCFYAYDKDCLGKLIWHEFNSKAEAEVFAELLDMQMLEHNDNEYDETKIYKGINDYLVKKKKHIEIKGGK